MSRFEVSDSLPFVRRFAPSNGVPCLCLSQEPGRIGSRHIQKKNVYILYTSPAGGRLTYQSDRHACICCCHISRLRQRSDISDSHSFARRCRSFKTGSLLIPGQALGRWEVVVYKKRAMHLHCSLFVISGFLSFQGASPQVLSAFAGLTAVFGMGTGGSPQLSPLNFPKGPCPYNCIKRTSLTSLRSVYGSFPCLP